MARFVLWSCLVVLCACSGESSPTAGSGSPARAGRADFGAATWVPEDCAGFVSLHAPGRLLRDITASRAFGDLARLPSVRAAIAEFERGTAMLQRQRRMQPLLDDWLAVLEDASERELFVTAGSELVAFTDAALGCVQETMFAQMAADLTGGRRAGRDQETVRVLLNAVLARAEALRLPPVTLGLRLLDPRRGASLVERLAAAARSLPGKVQSRREGDTDYRVWELTADAFPGWRPQLERGLAQGGLPPAQIKAFAAFVAGLKLSVAAGVRGDCLLFTVGHGTGHLAELGRSKALASAAAFAGLRARGADGLLSVAYVSGELRNLGRVPVPPILALVDRALPAAPLAEGRPGPLERFKDDLRRFLGELDGRQGTAPPLLSATFRNRGLETLRFGAGPGLGDAGAPLATLAKAGPESLLAVATRSAPIRSDYEWLARWAQAFFRHFAALAVPRMSERERAEFATFAATFGPAFAEFDATTREHLLPAVDGTEGLLVADGWLEFDRWPGEAQRLPAPLRLPRLALVWQLNDSRQWLQACRGYGAMVDGLLERLAANGQIDAAPVLPAPEARQVAGGTLWSWPLPGLDLELEPCMLVAGNTVVFASTPGHAQELLTRNAAPSKGLVDLRGPAACAGVLDFAQAWAWLQQDAQVVLRGLSAGGAMSTAEAQSSAMQVEVVLRALTAIRQFQFRCYRQAGADVEHSWLEVEDRR